MKRHITVDQLHELSGKAQEKLRAWWVEQPGDINYFDGYLYPLLSIGQMIEFLDDQIPDELKYSGTEYDLKFETDGYRWIINYFLPNKEGLPIFSQAFWKDPNGREICDALWGAVKSILETK